MTIARIEDELPSGLHDALLLNVAIDWPKATLTLTLRVNVTEDGGYRGGEIAVQGLVFCSIDPPQIDAGRHYEPTPPDGLWIAAGEGAGNDDAARRLPAIPEGCFLHWFFVQNWNRFIHICGRSATFTWTGPAHGDRSRPL